MDAAVRLPVTIVLSIAVLAAVQWLASRRIEPVHTYLYFYSWVPFIWALDRSLLYTKGRTYFGDRSARGSLTKYIWLAACSTTVWLVFEVLNFRLLNWLYIGVPTEQAIRWPGYALSYATVLPGLLFLADLFGGFDSSGIRLPPPLKLRRTAVARGEGGQDSHAIRLKPDPTYKLSATPLIVGLVLLALPMLWPRFFFPLIWLAFIFLLDPYVSAHGGRSLLAEWRRGEYTLTRALLLSGMACGLFWEACNFLAGAKWIYDVPFVGFLKLFEMPILGFFGFPVFALEAFVMTEAAQIFWRRQSPAGRWMTAAAIVGFWLTTFAGIDGITIRGWRT